MSLPSVLGIGLAVCILLFCWMVGRMYFKKRKTILERFRKQREEHERKQREG